MALADRLADRDAYAGALGDLANALRLSPVELAEITLAIAGQSPTRAREITAQHLRGMPAAIEPKPKPASKPQPQPKPVSGPLWAGGSRA